jgi:Domain of unknown function (DUF4129)
VSLHPLADRLADSLPDRVAAALAVDVPLQPGGAQGRAWARAELAGPGYDHPSLVRRALEWLLERIAGLPLPSGSGTALTGAVVVLVVLGAVVWAVRRAGGPLARGRRAGGGDVFTAGDLSAADHRSAADQAAAAGDLRTAVLERFRAVVRELEERAVVSEQPGRTASEAAAAAGARLPTLAADLAAAARTFDDVRYGGRNATVSMDTALRDLDTRLRALRVATTTGAPG